VGEEQPPKLPLSRGNTTNCHHGSLDPPTSTAQTASRSVHPVCRAHTLAAQHTRLSASSAASVSIFLSSSASAAASRNLSASSSVTALASSALHSDLLMSDSFAVINARHVKQLQRQTPLQLTTTLHMLTALCLGLPR